ncbi:MAG: ATPase, T2SS/T4P/T4SS family [Clostridia bacterium]
MEITQLEKKINRYLNEKIPEEVNKALKFQDPKAKETCKAVIQQFFSENQISIPGSSLDQSVKLIYENTIGYGPIDVFIEHAVERAITEIKVRGQREIYTKEWGCWKAHPEIQFRSIEHLNNIVNRILASSDKPLTESQPFVDNAELPNGSRVTMVRSPLTRSGIIMNIRIYTAGLFEAEALLKRGALTPEQHEIIKFLMRARMNTIFVGGTDTGKTTLMGAHLVYHNKDTHIVTIEDANELQLHTRHKDLNVSDLFIKKNEFMSINHTDLFYLSLRMSPDLYVFNEIRNPPETAVWCSAAISGHYGCSTSLHAEDEKAGMSRLEGNLRENDTTLTVELAREKICQAVDAFIVVKRDEDGTRYCSSIVEPIYDPEHQRVYYHTIISRPHYSLPGTFKGFSSSLLDLAERRNSISKDQITDWKSKGGIA